MEIPDYKSWDEAFFDLQNRGLGLEFGEPVNIAVATGESMSLGYLDSDKRWVEVRKFATTQEGFSAFKAQLPGLIQRHSGSETAKPKAQTWGETVQTRKVTFPAVEGLKEATEVTAVSVEDADLVKAAKDAARVGVQVVPILDPLPVKEASGITIPQTRQIFMTAYDPAFGRNAPVGDHEVFHAYALADNELSFQILDAIHEAGLDAEFDALYEKAKQRWGRSYSESDPVMFQYQIENEVMAEARAGATTILGRGIKKIGPTVRRVVRAWEKNWDATHKGVDPQSTRLASPNSIDLAARYQERGGLRDPSVDTEDYFNFEFDASDHGYDMNYLIDKADPMYSKLLQEVLKFKGEKLGAASVVSYLKGKGVKTEEIKWSGVEAFLEGKKSVTKNDLVEYLRDNTLRMETEVLSGKRDFTEGEYVDTETGESYADFANLKDAAYEAAVQNGLDPSNDEIRLSVSSDGKRVVASLVTSYGEKILLVAERPEQGRPAKWSEFRIPGGKNYREILFKLPGSDYTNSAMLAHWGQSGVLAHARVQDVTAADGGKVLFIEEIQSDWHNEGRSRGYESKESQTAREELEKLRAKQDLSPADKARWEELLDTIFPGRAEARQVLEQLDQEWRGEGAIQALRDKVADAAFNGDRGKAQDYLTGLLPTSAGRSLDSFARRHGLKSFTSEEVDALEHFLTRWEAAVANQTEIDLRKYREPGAPEAPFSKNYHEYVMKNLLREAAENGYDYVAWTTGKTQEERWSSDYAEGYRIEYDQDIPKFVNKYGKQWGVKVSDILVGRDLSRTNAFQKGGMDEVLRIANNNTFGLDGFTVAHAVPVNEDMRASVLYEGQPMFRVSETPEQKQYRNSYDAIYGDGAAERMLRIAGQAFAEAEKMAPTEAGFGVAVYGPEPQSVGAAKLRFDPYSYLQNRYGTIPQTGTNHRVADVPKSTTGTDKVMKTASTVMGAEATPENRLGTIAQAVVDGELSYVPVTNRRLNNEARSDIRKRGYNAVLSNWTRQVAEGKVNARIVATGATLLNNAGNSDMDGRAYTELLVDYANVLHRAGQALQAAKLLKKLSPEARLYEVLREVDRINQDIADRKNGGREKNGTPDMNVPVEAWMERTGSLLADELVKRISVQVGKAKARTVVDTILDDLYRRAKESVTAPSVTKSATRTEMERLQDMFDNYENYKEAWEAAKDTIRREYAGDEAVLENLDDWLNSALDLAKPLTAELFGGLEVTMSQELAEEYLAAKTEKARDEVMDRILQDIADQIPSTWGDKVNAWRYLAMLGNFRTQIRNVVGNTAMQPMRLMKETLNGLAEAMLQRAGVKIERTTSALYDMETFTAAAQDFQEVRDLILSGGKYDDKRRYSAEIESKRRIFKNAYLEGYRKATNYAMDEGDAIFSAFTYRDALARYMKANGTTWSQASQELKDKARARAIREAAEAAYRDNTALAELVTKIRIRNPKNSLAKGVNVVIEGALPFKKTPANILVRSVEYSPLGMLDAAYKTVRKARGADEISANDIINALSKSLSGTALVALGFALSALGVLKGKAPDDEKEKELWELQGHQAYSFEINGNSYTLDWLAPSSIPMFLGANLMDSMLTDGMTVDEAASAFGSLLDPMLEMSMLQGINDLLNNASNYGTAEAIIRLPANAAWNYLTQFVPTIVGQAARSLESDRMTTYPDKNNMIPDDLERKIGTLSGKVPVWDFARITYIDAWGRTSPNADSATLNALNQFFSPGYQEKVRETSMEKELLRLYEATGEKSVLPSTAPKYLTVNKERKDLTAGEYINYATVKGQTSFDLLTALTGNAAYRSMDDAQKAKSVSKFYDYANQAAKEAVLGDDFTAESWVYDVRTAAAELDLPVSTCLLAYTAVGQVEGIKDRDGKTVTDSKALRAMEALYNLPGVPEEKIPELAGYMGVAKSVRKYRKSMVERKLAAMEKRYGG